MTELLIALGLLAAVWLACLLDHAHDNLTRSQR